MQRARLVRQRRHERRAVPGDGNPRLDQRARPGGQQATIGAAARPLLEQLVALAQGPAVARQVIQIARAHRADSGVQEVPPGARRPLNHRQLAHPEQHHLGATDDLAGTTHRPPVHLERGRAGAPTARVADGHAHGQVRLVVAENPGHARPVRPLTNQRAQVAGARRGRAGQQIDGLQQRSLARGVRPQHDIEPRRELKARRVVAAEVLQRQRPQVHLILLRARPVIPPSDPGGTAPARRRHGHRPLACARS